MHRLGYLTPKPEVPFRGISFRLLQDGLNSLSSPDWFYERIREPYGYRSEKEYVKHPCNLSSTVIKSLRKIGVTGLDLERFKDRAEE